MDVTILVGSSPTLFIITYTYRVVPSGIAQRVSSFPLKEKLNPRAYGPRNFFLGSGAPRDDDLKLYTIIFII
jgi:hypothetical protein